jgi:Rad3-related DNA helicase
MTTTTTTTDTWLRPAQHDLISLVRRAPRGTSSAIEAPTGTGKTRAAMVAAATPLDDGRSIIATSTKALSFQYLQEVDDVSAATGARFKVLAGTRAMGCRCPRLKKKHYSGCPWPDHLEEAARADVIITNFALLAYMALGHIPVGSRSTVILDEAHEFAAPRDREPSPHDDNVYWQPDEIADLLIDPDSPLGGPVRLSLLSASINTLAPGGPDPFAMISAGIPVHRSAILPSPFDWSQQLSLSSRRVRPNDWPEFALDSAAELDDRGKLFITRSHRDKHRVGGALAASGYDVLLQADPENATPTQAVDVKAALNARPGLCVVGTDILMTGLDVPGDALGNVIVCGPPNLYGLWVDSEEVRARTARLNTEDVLGDYLIPTRSLRLAQAIGRGIRSTTDTATVLVGCEKQEKQIDDRIYAAAAARFSAPAATATAPAPKTEGRQMATASGGRNE